MRSMLVLLLERSREIGLMRALGTARASIVRALLGEVLLLSLAASGAGVAAGGVLCAVLARVGIPASSQAMIYAFGGQRFFHVCTPPRSGYVTLRRPTPFFMSASAPDQAQPLGGPQFLHVCTSPRSGLSFRGPVFFHVKTHSPDQG